MDIFMSWIWQNTFRHAIRNLSVSNCFLQCIYFLLPCLLFGQKMGCNLNLLTTKHDFWALHKLRYFAGSHVFTLIKVASRNAFYFFVFSCHLLVNWFRFCRWYFYIKELQHIQPALHHRFNNKTNISAQQMFCYWLLTPGYTFSYMF